MSTAKKIFFWVLAAASLAGIYFSAYLPYTKASKYINAVRQAGQARSVDELKKLFDDVFDYYSPIGSEEVVKFLSNDILSLISQEQATEDVSRLLVEYIEPRFFPENVRHMITGAKGYETLWRRWGKEEYYEKSEDYYLRAYAIGPKLPPVLYGMISVYYAHRDFDKAKKITNEALRYWPEDERLKTLVFPG